MLSYEEIMNYYSNYKIENGSVFDKNTSQQIIDEDTILKVKSSILLFKESQESYQSDMQQFGTVSKSQEDYIKKTMEKFSVHNEQNSFGINKLINAILNSNGHYEEFISGNDLQNSKFSILVTPKNEYGLAFLKLKFREKGLDIEDLKVSQDLSELQHNGVSKVIIDFKVKKYEKIVQNNPGSSVVETELLSFVISVISDIRAKYQKIENAYYENKLNPSEVSVLINVLERLMTESIKLKEHFTDSSIRNKINDVMDSIEELKKKMKEYEATLSDYSGPDADMEWRNANIQWKGL